jgi:ribose 5-phosphate isomerase A
MDQESLKKQSAEAALSYVTEDSVIGVGTGSTVKYFIEALASMKGRIAGAVASSVATEKLLKAQGIPVLDLNAAGHIALYVDGADEANHYGYLIKGRGGALTREKIIASVSEKFICIVDQSKIVSILGRDAPVPIEVMPMARSLVGRKIVGLRGNPVYRDNYLTDNGNIIIDAYNLNISQPLELENTLNCLPGVVENGLFAHRPADIVIVATPQGIETIRPVKQPS